MTDATVYVKGDRRALAYTPADRVKLEWDGFKKQADSGADYRALQARAKEAGVPANQSAADLQKALDGK